MKKNDDLVDELLSIDEALNNLPRPYTKEQAYTLIIPIFEKLMLEISSRVQNPTCDTHSMELLNELFELPEKLTEAQSYKPIQMLYRLQQSIMKGVK